MKPKTSPIWNYFLEVSSCAALCKTCEREYSRKGRTTSALKSHLKSLHPELFEEFQRLDDAMKNGLISKINNVAPVPNVTQQIKRNISILQEHRKMQNQHTRTHNTKTELCNESLVRGNKDLLLSRGMLVPEIRKELLNTHMWTEDNDQVSNNQTWTPEIKIELPNTDMSFKNEQEWISDHGNESPNLETWSQVNEDITSHVNITNIGHKRIWTNEKEDEILKRRKYMHESNEFWECSNEKSQEMDRLISEMIALDGLPIVFVESIGFRRVVNAALPSYKLNGSEFFATHIFEDLYHRVRNKIKYFLGKFEKLSFTVDIKKLKYGKSLLIVTAFGVDEDFHKKSMVLKCEVVEENTEQEISQKFQSMLQEWDIEYQRVHCVIHDLGNMKTQELYYNINCVIHHIHMSVNDVMESEEWFQALVKKLINITTHFEESVTALKELKFLQTDRLNQYFVTPLLVIPTRWNPWYNMMELFLSIKDSLSLYLYSKHVAVVTPEDWSNIEKFTKLYKPFKDITEELTNSKNSISSVVPLVQVLINALENGKTMMETSDNFHVVIDKLSEELYSILNNLKKCTHYTIATYLDPRYKSILFNDDVINEVEAAIIEIINKTDDNGESSSNNKISTDDTEANNETESQLNLMLESMLSGNDFEEQQAIDDEVKMMLQNYKKEKRLPLREDPLIWWTNNGFKYSLLLPTVRNFLGLPGSSVCKQKEEEMSDVKLSRIIEENSMTLLFLKYNMPMLNFDY